YPCERRAADTRPCPGVPPVFYRNVWPRDVSLAGSGYNRTRPTMTLPAGLRGSAGTGADSLHAFAGRVVEDPSPGWLLCTSSRGRRRVPSDWGRPGGAPGRTREGTRGVRDADAPPVPRPPLRRRRAGRHGRPAAPRLPVDGLRAGAAVPALLPRGRPRGLVRRPPAGAAGHAFVLPRRRLLPPRA